jgi:hypothetical protein
LEIEQPIAEAAKKRLTADKTKLGCRDNVFLLVIILGFFTDAWFQGSEFD